MIIDDLKNAAEKQMSNVLDILKDEYSKIRAGRAHPSLLASLKVACYGRTDNLAHLASVNVLDSRTLSVVPWDKSLIQAIEKAIMTSDLGLNPVTLGSEIKVPLPALSESRRLELSKIAKQLAEESKVRVRNIRREINNKSKDMLKKKEIGEDIDKKVHDIVQKITDKFVEQIDSALQNKEKDLLGD